MGVLQFPTALAGSVNVFPTYKYMVTTDNLASVTTPGYLNVSNTDAAQPMARTDMVVGFYDYNLQTQSGTYGVFTVSVSNLGVITLALVGGGITPITTWTPTITFATPGDLSVAYQNQTGTLTSSGHIGLITFTLNFQPTYTTASGNFRILGLPVMPIITGAFGTGFIQIPPWPAGNTMVSFNAHLTTGIISVLGMGSSSIGNTFTTTQISSGGGFYNIQATIPFFI